MTIGKRKLKVVREACLKNAKEALYGFFEPGRPAKICVDESLSGKILAETVFHEVLHAIDDLYDLKLRHGQVNYLGSGLADAFSRYLKF